MTFRTITEFLSNFVDLFSVPLPCSLTAGENLGIAALSFSLLAFIFSLAILLWLYLERRGLTLTTSDTVFNGKKKKKAVAFYN